MAIVIPDQVYGSQPGMRYKLDAEQVGGTGTKRTIKITLYLKCGGSTSSSSYRFPVQWRGIIGGINSDWRDAKGTEVWNATEGWRTFYWTYTVDVRTDGATEVEVGFETHSHSGSEAWRLRKVVRFGVTNTNTKPTMSGSVTIRDGSASGQTLTGIIPENISTLYLSWPAGYDAEQATGLVYGVNEQVDGAGGVTVAYPLTTLYTTVNIGAGNEGQRRKYYVDCRDSYNALSNPIYTPEITKNRFTTDTLASNSTVGFNSSNIVFTYNGASNTNGNTVFTRVLSCNEVTVYSPSIGAGSTAVSIWKSGTATPQGCYIRFDDIKERFKNSNYAGTLTFTLSTTNAYGTTKTSTKVINVDLKTEPSPVSGVVISTAVHPGGVVGSESTIYRKAAFNNTFYFVPDGVGVARVKWNAGSSQLGETFSYEVYVAYENGAWEKLANLPGSALHYDHVVPRQQSISQEFKYMVRTKSSYGYHSDAISTTQKLHSYNAPSISVGEITRKETSAEIPITISNISSITGMGVVGTWSGKGSGTLTSSRSQTIKVENLTGNGTYTIEVVYNDNTGFSPSQTKRISIRANLPIMFLNQYGLAVGGGRATSDRVLRVDGGASINGAFGVNSGSVADFNSCLTEGEYYCGKTSTIPNAPYQNSIFGKLTVTVSDGGTHNNSSNWIWQYFMDTSGRYYKRSKANSGAWTSWAIEYDTRNKPTLLELGAAASSHNHDGDYIPKNGPIETSTDIKTSGVVTAYGVKSSSRILCGANYNEQCIVSTYRNVLNFNFATLGSGKNYLHMDTSSGTSWGIDLWASDVKLKDNIIGLDGDKSDYLKTIESKKLGVAKTFNYSAALNTINKIEHYSFRTAAEAEENSYCECGYIANQLEQINKDFVMNVKQEKVQIQDGIEVQNPFYFEDDPFIKNPRASAIIPYITKAIQELDAENKRLNEELNVIKERLDLLS